MARSNNSRGILSFFSSPSSSFDAQDDTEDIGSSQKESQKMGGEVYGQVEESIRPYLDLIDTLRSVGIHKDIALPTIVVIGDQSSGKSSVLEALSGVALPRGSGVVTRCPLELKLRKVTGGVNWKAHLSYNQKKVEFVNSLVEHVEAVPNKDTGKLAGGAKKESRVNYIPKRISFDDPSLVEKHVKEAQDQVAGKGSGISDELLTLEIMSPDVCDLTLIDLPGIARVPLQGQPHDIGKKIKSLIMKFIKKRETINMVVVPCNIDIATTEALKMAQEVDPEGTRTVAVLTKPDLIDAGTERDVLAIAQNKVIPLRKGYIMVKCRGQRQIDQKIPLEEALQLEEDFFENHESFRCLLNDDKATITCLATKLTENLVDHIKKSLPHLDAQIKKMSSELRIDLKKIEDGPPQDPQGAKQFLIKTLSEFNDKIKSLSLGELIIQGNLFIQLRREYKEWNEQLNSSMSSFTDSTAEEIRDRILNNRGRELPGFSNYRVFEMLLQEHVAQLKDPAIDLLNTIEGIILRKFSDVSNECFQKYPNLRSITKDKIDHLLSSQKCKADQRIKEQFEMENMISTQDEIYFKTLNMNGKENFSEDQLPVCDKASKYSDMLKAYYEIMVQRMADQVPMLTRYFMLKEAAQILCTDMLSLLDGADVHEILFEDSDVSKRRIYLQTRLDRLSIAQEELSKFI